MMVGTAFLAFAYLWYTQLPVDGTFWKNLFVPFVFSGFGLAFIFIPMSLAALSRIEDRIAGVASGLLNTSQQLGGAVGVALISTISNERADTLATEGEDPLSALTGGYNWGFAAASVFALLAVGVAGNPQARRRSGRGRPAIRLPRVSGSPSLLHELRRRDLDVGVLEDPGELVPVELPVEAQPEPAAVPTYGGRKNRSGSASTSICWTPSSAAAHNANRPSPWWSFRTIAKERLPRTKNVG